MDRERVMLGWETPAIEAAAEHLHRCHMSGGQLDLAGHLIVTPSARAGRLLLGALVDWCALERVALAPPRFITPGELTSALLGPVGAPASPMLRELAFATALGRVGASALVPHPPAEEDGAGWGSIATMLSGAHTLIAAAGLWFADVPESASGLSTFDEAERWHAAAAVQREAMALLEAWGLHDHDARVIEAVRSGAPVRDAPITLVGVVDLPLATQRLLERTTGRVTALVWAPESLADRFDDLGLIVPGMWNEDAPPIDDGDLVFATDASDAADRTLALIAQLPESFSAVDVLVTAPEASVSAALERAADLVEGVRFRPAAGRALERSTPAAFLRAVQDHLERPRLETLAALLAHPDVERWARGQSDSAAAWLPAIDEFGQRHLVADLDAEPGLVEAGMGESLAEARKAAGTLLEDLAGPARAAPAWAPAIRATLSRVYRGSRAARHNPAATLVIETLAALGNELASLEQLEAPELPAVSASEAVRLLLGSLRGKAAPEPPDHGAVEIVGWLETALDPSAALIICGLNETWIPSAPIADPLLPDSLRRVLGLEDCMRRAARDTYLLRAAVSSRRHFKAVILGRSADGEPLGPSRLIFRGPDAELVRRAKRFAKGDGPPEALVSRRSESPVDRFSELQFNGAPAVTTMSVTSFRDYLASPYFFYLKHVLKLREAAAPPGELDALAFGTILHEVVSCLAEPELCASEDASAIARALRARAGALALERFGPRPPAAVAVQMLAIESRLDAFAAHQAARARDGWMVEAVDWKPPAPVRFGAPGGEVTLTGEIDRLDRHRGDGSLAILDYKSSDSPKKPETAHGPRKDGRWSDLQLPLYRHLAASVRGAREAQLGYIALPREPTATPFVRAGWTPEVLLQADEAARAVVRAVLAGEFQSLGADPPTEGTFGALCQATAFHGSEEDSAEEGDDA